MRQPILDSVGVAARTVPEPLLDVNRVGETQLPGRLALLDQDEHNLDPQTEDEVSNNTQAPGLLVLLDEDKDNLDPQI